VRVTADFVRMADYLDLRVRRSHMIRKKTLLLCSTFLCFAPTVVLETSPGNFQMWLDHGQVLPRDLSTLAARQLALWFDGDLSSADWRHYGRLAPSDIASGDNQWRKTLDTTTPMLVREPLTWVDVNKKSRLSI
jgi:RepB DNA-primase from phage plasmid